MGGPVGLAELSENRYGVRACAYELGPPYNYRMRFIYLLYTRYMELKELFTKAAR